MSTEEKRKAVEALLACCAGSEVGDLVDAIGDRELVGAYSEFLARLSALRAGER